MKGKSRRYKSDFARMDAIPAEPDEDIPEITRDQIGKTLIPVTDLFPELRRRGRPPASGKKEPLYILLDRDILAHFRATGSGWQTRINAILRRAMQRRSPRKAAAANAAKRTRAGHAART
jgi:uncharacterized protein (DUF4415 family)